MAVYFDILQGAETVLRALHEFESADWSPIAVAIKNSWEEEIFVVDAIDTGRMIRSVDWREQVTSFGDDLEFFIDTSDDPLVTYDGYVEGGTKYMKARYPARRGVENADFKQTIDVIIDDSFDNAII